MSLWKPFGRLEFVDLGKDFFLIRFGLAEDFNKVLRGGPWFIGEHYLTIRPWVPNFIPSEANCSSVAVWIQLPELPLEYYEESVLKDIGKAIGLVLRIDTQTASEVRGRYARLCVQVDFEQPLIRTVHLGTLSRPVLYEGISSLCFSCGRLGHRKDNCVYTAKEVDIEIVTGGQKMKDKTSIDPLYQKDEDYGPRLLVNRRKSGPRLGVKHASSPPHGGMTYQGSQGRDNPLSSQTFIASPKEGNSSHGTSKGKRKLGENFSYRNTNQSHVDTYNGIEPLVDTLETKANIECTLTNVNVPKSNFVFSTGKPSDSSNNSDHSSEKNHQDHHVRNSSSSKSGHGGFTKGSTVGNQTQRKDDSHPIRGTRSDQGKPNFQHGMARPRSDASMEVHLSTNQGESSDRNHFNNKTGLAELGKPVVEFSDGCSNSNRRKDSSVKNATFNFNGTNLMRIESFRGASQKEDVSGETNRGKLRQQHGDKKTNSSFPPDPHLQLDSLPKGNVSRNIGTLCHPDAGRGSHQETLEGDEVEFVGADEVLTSD